MNNNHKFITSILLAALLTFSLILPVSVFAAPKITADQIVIDSLTLLDPRKTDIVVDQLNEAPKGKVILFIDSGGGRVDLMDKIIYAMKHNKATEVVVVPQWAASAAAFITIQGDIIVLGKNAMILFHSPRFDDAWIKKVSGYKGDGPLICSRNNEQYINFLTKSCFEDNERFTKIYSEFFSKEELTQYNKGTNIIFSGSFLKDRLGDIGVEVKILEDL